MERPTRSLLPLRSCAALFFLALLATPPARALTGVDTLKIPPTARDVSMGGVLAMSAGAESLFYNPAGIGNLLRPALSLTHTQLYEGVRLDAMSLAYPLAEGWGRLGLSLMAMSMTALEARDEQGLPGGSFNAMDTVMGLSWAGELRHGLEGRGRFGVTLKRVEQRIADATAAGYALDLGAQSNFSAAPRVHLGASVQNLGPAMKFSEESFSQPLTMSLGAGYLAGDALLIQCGLSHRPNDKRTTVGAGAELWLGRAVALRSGYMQLARAAGASAQTQTQNPLSGLGFGAGWRPIKSGLRIDYAFAPGNTDLGAVHRITLGVEFGRGRESSSGPGLAAAHRMNRDNFWRVQSPWEGD